MAIKTKVVNNALVYYDSEYTHRWYDAFGPGVAKHLQDFVSMPADDQTTDPTEWNITVVEAGAGVSTAVLGDVEGGALVITTAADAADGWSMQLGKAAGESVYLQPAMPCYVGVKFQASDVTDVGILVGLCVTDTATLSGVTDGLYFRSANGSAVMNLVTEKNSVEAETAVGTLVAATDYTAEFLYDGYQVTPYLNGQTFTATANTAATFPSEEILRLTVEFINGASGVETCTIKELRLIHLRDL